MQYLPLLFSVPAVHVTASSSNVTSQSDADNAIRGYQRQIVARVLHDLEGDGHKLRQLGEYLEDVLELVPSEVGRAQVAKGHVDALAAQLSRLLIDPVNTMQSAPGPQRSSMEAAKPMSASSSTASTVMEPRTASPIPPIPPVPSLSVTPLSIARSLTLPPPLRRNSKKRRASLVIFPASPEKSQKRQDSHSIH